VLFVIRVLLFLPYSPPSILNFFLLCYKVLQDYKNTLFLFFFIEFFNDKRIFVPKIKCLNQMWKEKGGFRNSLEKTILDEHIRNAEYNQN